MIGVPEGGLAAKLGHYLLVFLIGSFSGAAGYILEIREEEKESGERVKLDRRRLLFCLFLGSLASLAVFILMTKERDPRATDYLWAALAGLKGEEILRALAQTVHKAIKTFTPGKK